MKIAFVTDVIYPYIKGGAEKRIYEFSSRLKEKHEVHVFGIQWWEGPPVIKKDGITYHGVCKPKKLYRGGRRSVTEALAFGLALAMPLLRDGYDVIDCNQHPYFSIFTCKLASLLKGGRLYVTWHEVWGDYWYEYMGFMGFFGKLIERVSMGMPDRIIAVSGQTAAALERMGVKKDRVLVVPNGISVEAIGRIKEGERHDVVFAGRLIRDKHVDVLLKACEAASRSMPLDVLIIGDGPERASLEALASSLGVNGRVTFAGAVDEKALLASVKAARVFILPSTREGFSITTLEALACGVPVITVDGEKNSAKELIEDGVNGVVVGLKVDELGGAIQKVLCDEGVRKKMAVHCAPSVGRYDWDALNEELLECYARR
ncbi:MAG TPA: glycosyltransferase family 4 protein [Methanocella sp.]|nr:glycosyltransferase family 4 protein [Methanocella sp.]